MASFDLVLESGAVWQHRNDVRISPEGGTYFSIDEFDQGAFLHARAEAFLHLGKRHGLRLLYAPFSVSVTGQSEQNVIFDGITFNGGQDLTVNYQFNSYRLTYFYKAVMTKKHQLYLGFTGKIRDAFIQFEQGALSREYDNVGFVPLFYFFYQYQISNNWTFVADLDGSAAPQGRAFDFSLKVRRRLSDSALIGLGYRTLEGGADNDKVFSFSWFNYAVVDFMYQF
ncbi:MAG: hypothetical protein HRT44_07755 [Bdellovibrionales bacterium]|nr:hypothetical protein [Bdellovibrionales bacterium]